MRKSKVQERLEQLRLFNILLGRFDKKISIDDMNKWIKYLVSVDKSYDIILTIDDFKEYDYIVYGYMSLCLNEKSTLSKDSVIRLIFNSPNIKDLDVTENPILDLIKLAIYSVQIKKGFLDAIGFRTTDEIDREIRNCNDILAREVIDSSSYEASATVQICDSIIDPYLSEEEKNSVRQRLYYDNDSLLHDVCLYIVRLGIYYNLLDDSGLNIDSKYREYRKNSKYNGESFINEIRTAYNAITIQEIAGNIDSERPRKNVDMAIERYNSLVSEYISNFYLYYGIKNFIISKGLGSLLDELIPNDNDGRLKLFGEFDILCMPPAIKAYSKFANDGIRIPVVNSEKFIDLCLLTLSYLKIIYDKKQIMK